MILGIDHIALSCTDIKEASAGLEKNNFSIKFCEQAITNSSEKKSFLNHYEPEHSLAYAEAATGPAIELTQHGKSLGSGLSVYEVQQNQGKIESVKVHVSDLEASRRFWCEKLRFQEVEAEAGQSELKLEFRSPFPQWNLEVVLVQGESAEKKTFLDAEGFTCIAFISNNIEEDLKNVQQPGLRISKSFSIEVNQKLLKVAMAEGPSGEIIELIEIQKNKVSLWLEKLLI